MTWLQIALAGGERISVWSMTSIRSRTVDGGAFLFIVESSEGVVAHALVPSEPSN